MHNLVLGSIQEYIETLDYKPMFLGTLKREFELTEHVLRQWNRTVYARIEDVEGLVFANLLPTRETLYKALNVDDDKNLYQKLLSSINSIGTANIVQEEFNKYYENAGDEWRKYLPLIKFYEKDGGYYLTSTIFIACINGICNASIHRVMFKDNYVAVRVVPRHLYRMLSQANKGLPVAVVEGIHPLVMLAAALSPPYGVFELQIAANILNKPLSICKTPKYKLPVPCGATIIVEGRLGPERAEEGPFIDILGLYDRVREEPILHIESVYLNKEVETYHHAIVPASAEHMLLMGLPREAQIYEQVSRVAEVVKVRLTPQSGMWLHAVISIRKRREGEPVSAGLAALAGHPSLKHVIIVDEDIDPDDPCSVEWAIATRLQAGKNITIIRKVHGSTLDPSSNDGLTDKMIIDATAPLDNKEKFEKPLLLHKVFSCKQAD